MNKGSLLEMNCYRKFINANGNLGTMRIYANNLGLSINNYLGIVQRYINININKPDYVKILDIISELNDDEVIIFLEKNNINEKILLDNLLSYCVNYKPYHYFLFPDCITNLKEKLLKYNNYKNQNESQLKNRITSKKTVDLEYMKNVVKSFINCKYSLKRFCFNNNISLSVFSSYVKEIKKSESTLIKKYNGLYYQFEDSINRKNYAKEYILKQDVIKILKQIEIKKENFSLIDFCLLTNFDISEIIAVADIILDKNEVKLIRKVLNSKSRQAAFNGGNIRILNDEGINNLFKINFKFNINDELIEINDEDKYVIINYLRINNIPICNETFKDCCVKLYNKRQENLVKVK